MLRYAILTLLADEARSGYDLSKHFAASVTYVWPARQSQIYPELHRLEAEGLVEATKVAQSSKPDKNLYRVTAAGRRALEAWVGTTPETPSFRDSFQLRALNFGRVELDTALSLLEQQKGLLVGRIETFEQVVEVLEAGGHVPGERLNPNVGWRVAIEAGLVVHRAYRDWCDWAAKQLKASAAAAAKVTPRKSSRGPSRSPRRTKSGK